MSENEPTVLCVNDDYEQLDLLEVQLRLAHYRVLRAFDGLEAYEIAKREHPDLVISDVSMPRSDGIELCQALRADADLSPTPILLLSAMRKDTESAIMGLRAGADEYLEAPYSPMRLVALAARLVERKRSEDELRRQALVFKMIRDGVVILGLDGNITDLNPAAERIFGYSKEEAVGLNPSLFHPPSCKKLLEEDIPQSLIRRRRWAGELPFVNKDGICGVADAVVLVQRDAQKNPISIVAVHRDITERKRTEAERQVISEIIQGVSSTLNLDELLSLIHGALGRVLYAENCFVALYDKENALLEMEFFVDKHDAAPLPQKISKSRTSYVFQSGQPLLMTGEVFRRLAESGEVEQCGTAPATWLGVPLRSPTEVIGVLVVQSYDDENAYSARDLEFLSSVGGQIALAIERKRAEGALRRSEQFSRNVLESSRDCIKVLGLDGSLLYMNRCGQQTMEIDDFSKVKGCDWGTFWGEAARPLVQSAIESAADGGGGAFEGFCPTLKGTPKWWDVVVSPITDGSGQVVQLLTVSRDVSDRKQAEGTLHEMNETLRALIKGSALAIVALDTKNLVTAWNPAAERIFGWSESEVLGRPVPTLSNEMREATLRLLERVYNGEVLTGHEMTRHRKDGMPVEVSISFSLLRDAGGAARGAMAVLEDITERKLMDAALKEANERAILEYERLLERIAALAQSLGTSRDLSTVYRALKDFSLASTPCSSMLVSIYDKARAQRTAEYVWSGNEEVALTSLSPMPMNDSPHSRAVTTGQIVIADDLQAAVAGKHVLKVGEHLDPRPPLSALIVPMAVMGRVIGAIELQSLEPAAFRQGHATAMRMAANLAAVAIENVRLIDQEHEKEEQLRQSQKMQAVGQLAGGVAHDFNNLLVAINGYSDLTLRRLQENDPLRRNLEEIKRAGERAAALTRQLLAFSRKQVMQPKVLCLNDVVSDIDKILRRVIGEDIELTTLLDADLGRVKADPNMLEQVVLNLAVNSRDAMPDGGRLTVETSNVLLDEEYTKHHVGISPGAYVMLAVSDTGAGMDAETQRRIFEPFFTTKEVGKGTGLGLSTVYGIVKQSGGNVWVYSEVGHGTAFKVYLPRVDEAAKVAVHESDAYSLPTGTEKILLVEDDTLVRNVVREIISAQGYTVLEAEVMSEAVRHCEENDDISLLLSDVVMPHVNGKELSLHLTKLLPGMRVLFMSGYSESVVHNGVLEEGVNFIQKPFTSIALLRKLREVLDGDTEGNSLREDNLFG